MKECGTPGGIRNRYGAATAIGSVPIRNVPVPLTMGTTW